MYFVLCWATKLSLGTLRLGWMSSFPLKDNSCILPNPYRKSCIFSLPTHHLCTFHYFFHYLIHLITFYYLHYLVDTLSIYPLRMNIFIYHKKKSKAKWYLPMILCKNINHSCESDSYFTLLFTKVTTNVVNKSPIYLHFSFCTPISTSLGMSNPSFYLRLLKTFFLQIMQLQ